MSRRILAVLLLFSGLSLVLMGADPQRISFDRYHSPREVNALLKSFVSAHSGLARLITVAISPGRTEICVLRLAAQPPGSSDPDLRPGVFVGANLEGAHLVGTEAALMLIEKLATEYASDKAVAALLDSRVVYVAPLLNPDAASAFFAEPRSERYANGRPLDDDRDGLVDEDGPEDLNQDGLITQMRVKDPEGKWIADPKDARLMREADPQKGEKGVYKLYSEGIDNDGDGEYNEDPPGGVELNRNFPHDFEYNTVPAGIWPVSEDETVGLLDFLCSHRNIALVLNFSTENTVLNLQQTGQARVGGDKVKVPARFASFLGLDPEQEYTLKEIVDVLKGTGLGRGMEISEEMVASFLGLGPAVSIDRQDLPLFEAVQKEYKDAAKEAKFDYPEKRAKGVGKGSFVAYCYYQYGVPVFSLDLWKVPEPRKEPSADALTSEKLKTMSAEEFLSLGEDKIAAFLKEQGAPPNFNAGMLMKMVKSGQVTPPRMAEMMEKMPRRARTEGEEHPHAYILKWADAALQGKGFVNWAPYNHPTLGEVEIGGFVPHLKVTPPPEDIAKAISFPTDFYIKLMDKLAGLQIRATQVEALGPDVYQVTAYFANPGWFPTTTAQGRRARSAWPIRVRLKTAAGQSVFSGRAVETIAFLGGSGDTKKLEWTIKGEKSSPLTIEASSPKLGTASATVVLK